MAALSSNALAVLERRYLLRDAAGALVETPEGLFRRVARAVARAEGPRDRERCAERFEARMSSLEFLPNSPTLMNAGRPSGQLAACFVLPVEDDLAAIFDALKWAALIHQSGGGTGFAFSRLRPRGDPVRTTHGIASGPLSFIRVFDAATETIKQGGVRRGANMAVLRVDHPDILEFVDAKRAPGLANFNLSVGAPDAFMRAAAAGERFALRHPRTGAPTAWLDARELLATIAARAWECGEPGLVFLDRLEEGNPTPDAGRFEAVNPCGEQPLLPFEACTLGSLNLSLFARGASVDYARLEGAVRDAVRFLDDVLEINAWPLPQIAAASGRNRKIGLGVMGWADLLLRLGVPYDAPEGIRLADEVMGFVQRISHDESARLAVERGPFPGWPTSAPAAAGARPRRNATLTTIAPTGTLALLAGCSSGIEPLFALTFVRRAMGDTELQQEHRLVLELLSPRVDARALEAVRASGRARGVPGVPEELGRLLATAHDLTPEAHVQMQAAFQRHTDNAVSKTVNLPRLAAVADVERALRLAFESGCKGITVYREGTRPGQVLAAGDAGVGDGCPHCGGSLTRSGGCASCPSCGFTSCETTT